MANPSKYGFRAMYRRGGPLQMEKVRVASAYQASPGGISCDLNIGDPIIKVSDGTIAIAAAGVGIFGVIAGIGKYWNSGLGAMVPGGSTLPGGTTYGTKLERESIVYIYPAADVVFEVDCDDGTTAATQAAYTALIGENCDITINQVSGSTLASPLLDISDHKTGTAQFRIVDLGNWPTQDYTTTRVKLLVTCVEVQQAPWQATGV